ncbi:MULTISPECIES: AI-2E family transporter [unclassified Rhodanobacter]|uniref:AI-2E family transporter n=1 Tax=unclassified Rhodanobacter TaxID=2621553 RepID=UPI0007AA3D2D|nr:MULTISPECIES: AI-2E family transporter [unclassified Rhodanobacter]KZC16204.1 AI-2E family transporter [Rhodanobacter sp. FW104-R8]KZC26193.1 AI-2E family transporter [Rhodanobacter sp. FW510-T8]KZC30035.1 AI-2E family transporter [Rhodanobacter sp. FW510-R10]
MNQDKDIPRRWQLLAIAAVIVYLIWLLAPVLMPFAVAAMLAYLGDPLVDRLERLRLNRTWAATIVFVVIMVAVVGVLLLLIPLIARQIENLVSNLPRYGEWAQNTAWPWLQARLHLDPHTFDSDRLLAAVKGHLASIGGVATAVLGKVSRGGLGIAMWLTNLVLIPVVAFYLLRDWDRLVAKIDGMLPRSIQPTIAYLASESDKILGAFVRGQLLVMLALGVFYGAGLSVVGLTVGPLIGMVAGLLSFVPYLGFIIGFVAAIVAALVQYGDWAHVLMVCGVFTVGQLLEGYVLVPKLVGDKIGLHPVAVMFAVLAGGYLFGFLGVLLALPAASVIMVLLRYLIERYRMSELYNEAGPEDPVIAEAGAAAPAAAPPGDPPAP